MNSIQRESARESHQVMAVLPKEQRTQSLSCWRAVCVALRCSTRVATDTSSLRPHTLAAQGLSACSTRVRGSLRCSTERAIHTQPANKREGGEGKKSTGQDFVFCRIHGAGKGGFCLYSEFS